MFENKRKNHLKSKLIIDQLFSIGKVITKHPFRLVYLTVKEPTFTGVQHLISVPKRNFKLAVSRNKIRRKISEVYRLNSSELKDETRAKNVHVAIGIIYIGKKETEYAVVDQKLTAILHELVLKIKA